MSLLEITKRKSFTVNQALSAEACHSECTGNTYFWILKIDQGAFVHGIPGIGMNGPDNQGRGKSKIERVREMGRDRQR